MYEKLIVHLKLLQNQEQDLLKESEDLSVTMDVITGGNEKAAERKHTAGFQAKSLLTFHKLIL